MDEDQNVSDAVRSKNKSRYFRFNLFLFTIVIMLVSSVFINSIIVILYVNLVGTKNAYAGLIEIIFLIILSFTIVYSITGILLFFWHKKKPNSKKGLILLWLLICLLISMWCIFRGMSVELLLWFKPRSLSIFMLTLCALDFILSPIGIIVILFHLGNIRKKGENQ